MFFSTETFTNFKCSFFNLTNFPNIEQKTKIFDNMIRKTGTCNPIFQTCSRIFLEGCKLFFLQMVFLVVLCFFKRKWKYFWLLVLPDEELKFGPAWQECNLKKCGQKLCSYLLWQRAHRYWPRKDTLGHLVNEPKLPLKPQPISEQPRSQMGAFSTGCSCC